VPATVAQVADLMSGYPARWSLCGGWAVSAWLGRVSRDHGDVDISVFDADNEQLFHHLAGWQLIPHSSVIDDGSTGLWDGRPLPVPSHIHARSPADAGPLPSDGICEPSKGWWLDIQVDGREGGEWVLSRQPRVSLPLRDAVRESPWGIPAVVPEVLLFFKARDLRRRDRVDFQALLPLLDTRQRRWLRDAVAQVGHPWLPELSRAAKDT
jgi:hypothetical protein